MSRADEKYLVKLFEMEVPEIYDGIVEIMSAAREPGQRAKIAVRSKDNAVDPVGACVGMKGSRVQNIVQELRGEKIDIVMWDEDMARFACNALAPAEIAKVFVDEGNREMEIVVPDSQLSLAIGKKGQNVRLAAKLTGWRLDILSESSYSSRTTECVANLKLIAGINDTMAQSILQSGFSSVVDVAKASVVEINGIPGYEDVGAAEKLIEGAKAVIAKFESEGQPVPVPSTGKETRGSAKEQAALRLKQEMQKLEEQENN
jgi:N utilization substance protein A